MNTGFEGLRGGRTYILERNRGDYSMSIFTGKIFKCAIRGETRKGGRRKEGFGVGGRAGKPAARWGGKNRQDVGAPTGRWMKGRREKKSAKNINDHVVMGAWTLGRVSKQSCVAFVHSIQEITRGPSPPRCAWFLFDSTLR